MNFLYILLLLVACAYAGEKRKLPDHTSEPPNKKTKIELLREKSKEVDIKNLLNPKPFSDTDRKFIKDLKKKIGPILKKEAEVLKIEEAEKAYKQALVLERYGSKEDFNKSFNQLDEEQKISLQKQREGEAVLRLDQFRRDKTEQEMRKIYSEAIKKLDQSRMYLKKTEEKKKSLNDEVVKLKKQLYQDLPPIYKKAPDEKAVTFINLAIGMLVTRWRNDWTKARDILKSWLKPFSNQSITLSLYETFPLDIVNAALAHLHLAVLDKKYLEGHTSEKVHFLKEYFTATHILFGFPEGKFYSNPYTSFGVPARNPAQEK